MFRRSTKSPASPHRRMMRGMRAHPHVIAIVALALSIAIG